MLREEVFEKVLLVFRMTKYFWAVETLHLTLRVAPADRRRRGGQTERLQYAGAGPGPHGQVEGAVLAHLSEAQCTEEVIT